MVFHEIAKFLVVDADNAHVKYLRGALQSVGCRVTTCKYLERALLLLYDQKREFDIVLANVNKPYEMGFKFVEIVSSKMNLPIIIMCSAGDKEIISAGINHDNCKVVVKPVGIDDVRQFCQYVVTHRRQHLMGVGDSASNSEELHGQDNRSNQGTTQGRLYKDRLTWTEDLKALFVEAVHALGGKDVAVPRKIMDWMNVPNVTRENIASHLQKYRLYSDPNYAGGKGKGKVAQLMLINRMDEQAPVVAHPNRRVLSFEAPEFARNTQNVLTQHLFDQTEGKSKNSLGMNIDWMQLNKIVGNGNQQDAYFEEPKVAQFPIIPESDTWQQLYDSPNVHSYVPEPTTESVMMQGMVVPEGFGDSSWPSLHVQSSFELQVPSDGIRSKETPTTLDSELKSFLAMNLNDPNFLFFNKYPLQEMSMIFGGLSNGLHDNNYPVGQKELGLGDLSSLNDRITNDPATNSLVIVNREANNPMAMQYPQNISSKGGIVDYSNVSRQQQQEQIGWSPLEQPGSISGIGTSVSSAFGQGTSQPSTFERGTRNDCFWFGPKPPRAI